MRHVQRSRPYQRSTSAKRYDQSRSSSSISIFRGHCRERRGQVARESQARSKVDELCRRQSRSPCPSRTCLGLGAQFLGAVAYLIASRLWHYDKGSRHLAFQLLEPMPGRGRDDCFKVAASQFSMERNTTTISLPRIRTIPKSA